MTKDEYYLEIAKVVAKKSTCLKKHYGAIIVKNDEIIATGYNGACRGEEHCKVCTKIDHGKDMETFKSCASVHAEMNCIISAARKDMIDSTLYLACIDVETNEEVNNPISCEICARLIKNAGIARVINRTGLIYSRKDNNKDSYFIELPNTDLFNVEFSDFVTSVDYNTSTTEWSNLNSKEPKND